MVIQKVFATLRPQLKIGQLIFDILVLEERLKHPNSQSFYFRRGLKNHLRQVRSLKQNFNRLRHRFNSVSIDDLLSERSEKMRFIEGCRSSMQPSLNKQIAICGSESIVSGITDMIYLKSLISFIPDIEECKQNSDLLQALFENPSE